jgi:hypothetical protein
MYELLLNVVALRLLEYIFCRVSEQKLKSFHFQCKNYFRSIHQPSVACFRDERGLAEHIDPTPGKLQYAATSVLSIQ